MLLGTLIIYLSMLNLDNLVDSASTRVEEEDCKNGGASAVVAKKDGLAGRWGRSSLSEAAVD